MYGRRHHHNLLGLRDPRARFVSESTTDDVPSGGRGEGRRFPRTSIYGPTEHVRTQPQPESLLVIYVGDGFYQERSQGRAFGGEVVVGLGREGGYADEAQQGALETDREQRWLKENPAERQGLPKERN